MDLLVALTKVAELERSGSLSDRQAIEAEIEKVMSAFTGRIDFLDQDEEESEEVFAERVNRILPIIFNVVRENSTPKYTKIKLSFTYMDAALLTEQLSDPSSFVLSWFYWMGLESPETIALWHKEESINDQYQSILNKYASLETKKTLAERLVSSSQRTNKQEVKKIIVDFALSIHQVEVPSTQNVQRNLNKLIDAISFNRELVEYFKEEGPDLLEQEYLWIYKYMSKELDWDNSSRILFTPKEAVFIPANWKSGLFRKGEGLTRRPIEAFQSCDVGDQHNTFNYGFTGRDESYYFQLYWTMKNGSVFLTSTFAGMDIASAKSAFNQNIEPMAKSLAPYIDFSLEGGHSETRTGSNLSISYGVWF